MILILTQCYPSRLGGIESLISNLALGLARTKKIIVFADSFHTTNDKSYDEKYKELITIKRITGIKYFRRRKKIREMKRYIISNKVDLVLCDTWKSLELGIDYLNLKKIPTLCLAHGNEVISENYNKKKRIQEILNKVNTIVTNSLFTEKLVKNIIDSHTRTQTIYPGGVDLSEFKEKVVDNVSGSPMLLTLARLEKRKGHSEVINAIFKLLPEFPNIQYVIAGEGKEFNNLKKLVYQKNLQKNIIFVGKVNDSQKRYLYHKADLLVMPTLDETLNRSIEGFGIVYIEAAFFAVPSVASKVGGTPEAVIHNDTGIIINNINELYLKIRELLLDKNKLSNLGLNAKNRANAKFKWDYVTDKYLLLIDKIIKNT